jgi:four helix bundle protein
MKSQSYKDLIVWQKGIDLCIAVYTVCSDFLQTERYGLADQMKRAAGSIPSNLAEGQARQHRGEFLQFLYIANGSLAELDSQRIISERLGFISTEQSQRLQQQVVEISKMLSALNSKLKTQN